MASATPTFGFYLGTVGGDTDLWGGLRNTTVQLYEDQFLTRTQPYDFSDQNLDRSVLRDTAERFISANPSGNTVTLDFAASVANRTNHFETVLDQNVTTVNILNGPGASQIKGSLWSIAQNGTGGFSVTFPAAFQFAGGSTPTITATANAVDIFTLIPWGGVSTIYVGTFGQDFS